jgi:serine/threonine protein kinase
MCLDLAHMNQVCIIDFGFAKCLDPLLQDDHKHLMKTACGSPEYAGAYAVILHTVYSVADLKFIFSLFFNSWLPAPEISLGAPYIGYATDLWSMGAVLYTMCVTLSICVRVFV